MVTFQQYIEKTNIPIQSQYWGSGMQIQLYYCGLIKFCNESDVQTVEQLIINVDIDEITDFPYWSSALDLTRHAKILTNAYEYIRPELKSNIRCAPINWERVASQWLKLLDGDTVTEQQALFALFALPAAQALDEAHPVRIAWEERLEEIWAKHKPKLPVRRALDALDLVRDARERKFINPELPFRTQALVTFTPDSSKYDISNSV